MSDRLPALIFGLLLCAGGALLLWSHVRTWRARRDDSSLPDEERQYYRRQFRRRIQVSSLVVVIGAMLPIMDIEDFGRNHPGWWTASVMIVLALTLWIMFLAYGDLVSTRSYSKAALARLRQQQRELEQEAARLKGRTADVRSDN